MGVNSVKAALFCMEQMEKEFPLGCLRDESATACARPALPETPAVDDFFRDMDQHQAPKAEVDDSFKELRLNSPDSAVRAS